MNPPVLEVSHLTFGYQEDTKVLQDVSFSVEEGAHIAIVGHNGSGKSTLTKTIMGLTGHFDGQITLFGMVLSHKTLGSLRSRIGIVFQNPDNQFVGSTVADDIAFGLENRQVPHEEMQGRIERFASDVGMENFLDHEPGMLSGGQKQRVAIAGVLAMQPDLVIFDEATAMLDPKGKKEIAGLVEKMKTENPKLAILTITHDVEEAASCDGVLVMSEGRIVMSGTPKEVFSKVEELKSLRLAVPFAYELANELRKQGLDVPNDIVTTNQLEDYLCR